MSHSRKGSISGADGLGDRFKNSLRCNEPEIDKPDFRELDLGSPVSPLLFRRRGTSSSTATTSSSSSSSGSVSGRNGLNPVQKRSDLNHSSELSGSVDSSPGRGSKPGYAKSDSGGSSPLIYSGGTTASSPALNTFPAGNICPSGNICRSGKVLTTGMANRATKNDVLGSGTGNYGHGSIMRGGGTHKSSGASSTTNSKGLVVGETLKGVMRNDPEELKWIGNEHYKKGQYAEALNLYDKAIAISPRNAAYHCNRAAALIALKRVDEALRECEEAVRLDQGYVRAHHRLGSLFLSLGQVENARRHMCLAGHQPDHDELKKLERVEKHIGKCNDARRLGDWRSMLREADGAIASGAEASPQLFACRAEALLKLSQLDDADSSLSNVPQIKPTTQSKIFGMFSEAYLLFVRAQVELALGRFGNALSAIEKAGQIDSRNIEVSLLLSNVRLVSQARIRGNDLFKSERYTEACAAYGDGLRLDPSNSVLYCNRAACWYKLGQWEKSVGDCNQALHIQPKYTKALLRRAASNMKLELWAEAVRDYEVLKRELPHDNEVAESLFHARGALKKSRGEEVHDSKFGREVEIVSGLEQFRAAISSPGVSVVQFKAASNVQCWEISAFLDTLCSKYRSINFLKVDVEDCPVLANAENVRIVPTFKIYKKGERVKDLVCPSPEELESLVRHYCI
ncbi:PREDICTED: TPR repeat-containing thioredoxin TTL1-like [Ipomoea nil]|uniref:TPR repeat-containing thioredoxin TTL1-like n=1 Tax=Ipomoea nil TaxID=35883 RepID=UPI000901D671|nr:PREDICTED: TPR repeat-containing thioredoxin TTL1-like [Ipomoea nil]